MDGYSEIAREDIAMFVQNYVIKNHETYKEFTKSNKFRVAKRVTKARKACQGNWERQI
jgi:hypothetical protein